MKLGRNEEAIRDFTKAIDLNPQNTHLGKALLYLGRKEEAIIDYTTAIEINPQDHKVYFNRG